jgi:hypothetical protein
MDSIIEKITMYDILGYMVPGLLFLILGFSETIFKSVSNGKFQIEKFGDFSAIIMLVVMVVAYASGIAMSEMMRWLCILFQKLAPKQMKSSDIHSFNPQVKQALKNSKYLLNEDEKGDVDIDYADKYFEAMYADIQADKNYSRIHNYASSECFYKNLAMATALGFVVNVFVLGGNYGGIAEPCQETVVAVILVVVFLKRYARFVGKKKWYTMRWFVEKYN